MMIGYQYLENQIPGEKQNGHHVIVQELNWLKEVLQLRLQQQFAGQNQSVSILSIQPPDYHGISSPYADFVRDFPFSERLIMILGLAPHILPGFLDDIISQQIARSGDYPQLGGVKSSQFRGFLPTGETALFLLAGNNLENRFNCMKLFGEEHLFSKRNVLHIEDMGDGEPEMTGKIIVEQDYVDLFLKGKISKPRFGTSFPAQLLETNLTWDHLVLNPKTNAQIEELKLWLQYNKVLADEWGMGDRLSPGYRVLFYGAPGTGKTLTAKLLGKFTGLDVYRIDLSTVISKYIGETEKNLASLFSRASDKDWILFFDEADALFGKRTNIRDAHDKYANQEVAYLLQRIETFNGLAILATNFRNNIDDAFIRRFQSLVFFPMPRADERLAIWRIALPDESWLEPGICLPDLAQQYEINGANIMNIVQYACLKAIARNEKQILLVDIMEGLRKEYVKEGKIV
jgi:hypothetical protein